MISLTNNKMNLAEKVKNLFAPREDIVLDDEDKGLISDLQTRHPEIYAAVRKYMFNKINIVSRKFVTCKKEELEMLQDRSKTYLEIIKDFEEIKKNYLRMDKKEDKMKSVKKGFLWYVKNNDVRDRQTGKVRLNSM